MVLAISQSGFFDVDDTGLLYYKEGNSITVSIDTTGISAGREYSYRFYGKNFPRSFDPARDFVDGVGEDTVLSDGTNTLNIVKEFKIQSPSYNKDSYCEITDLSTGDKQTFRFIKVSLEKEIVLLIYNFDTSTYTQNFKEGETISLNSHVRGCTPNDVINYTFDGFTQDDFNTPITGTTNIRDWAGMLDWIGFSIKNDFSVNEGNESGSIVMSVDGLSFSKGVTIEDTSNLTVIESGSNTVPLLSKQEKEKYLN